MSAGAKRKQLGRGLSSLLGKDTLVEDIKPININQAISISNIQPGAVSYTHLTLPTNREV